MAMNVLRWVEVEEGCVRSAVDGQSKASDNVKDGRRRAQVQQ